MIASLDTGTALVVELLRGPGYGLDLIERVRLRSGGMIRLRQGVVYPALRERSRRKWLRNWSVATPGSGETLKFVDLPTLSISNFARAVRKTCSM